MSCLILPRRFYSQPQGIDEIDWRNPICADLISVTTPSINTSPGVITTGSEGLAMSFAGTSGAINGVTYALGDINSSTCGTVLVYRIVKTGGENGIVAMAETSGGYWRFGFWDGYTGDTKFRTRDTSTGDTGAGHELTMSAGTVGTLEVRVGTTDSVAGVKIGYINGVQNASTSTSVDAFTSTQSSFIGLGTLESAVSYATSGIFLIAFWRRALSAYEVKTISANPWQIFKPSKRVLYFDATSFPVLTSLGVSYITSSGGRLTAST